MKHASDRFDIYGDSPEIVKLPNSRYRITLRCDMSSKTEDWYYDHREDLWRAFGDLYSEELPISGANRGWTPVDGEEYPDMAIISQEWKYLQGKDDPVVEFIYETLTSTWTNEDDDTPSSTENGLRVITRNQVALPDTALPYDEDDVGVATITDAGKTLYLAAFEDTGGEQRGSVTLRWLEAGTLNRTDDLVGSQQAITIQAIGEVPSTPAGYSIARTQVGSFEGFQTNDYTFLKDNTVLSRNIEERSGGVGATGVIRIETVEVFNGTPTSTISGVQIGDQESNVDGIPTRRYTFAKGNGQIRSSTRPGPTQIAGTTSVLVESVGTAVVPTGALIRSEDIEEDGFVRYIREALQGTITGVQQTYKDVVDVRVPGTVNLTTVAKAVGGISGTIAVADVTPPRTKKIAAQVTVEITTTPPDTASLAYDLGAISCSVTSISMSENFRGTDVFQTASGNTRFSGTRRAADMSARISTYPECYLSGATSASGTFSYTSSFENTSTSPNSIVTNALTSTTNTFVDGTGSVSDTSVTTGILRRDSRPILTTIDGTTYYEVITWSV